MTGTVREMSGLTTPVTVSCEAALYSAAVARGNCAAVPFSTWTMLASPSCSTCAGGGASAAAFLCAVPAASGEQ